MVDGEGCSQSLRGVAEFDILRVGWQGRRRGEERRGGGRGVVVVAESGGVVLRASG